MTLNTQLRYFVVIFSFFFESIFFYSIVVNKLYSNDILFLNQDVSPCNITVDTKQQLYMM